MRSAARHAEPTAKQPLPFLAGYAIRSLALIKNTSPEDSEGHLETGDTNHRHTPQVLGNGRYELCEFISKGGMGAVYRARDVELDRSVAVKCLLDVARQGSRELAVKEARTLASLSHPNIMRVFDILSVGDQVWIVSEWLEGKCLAQLPLPLPPPSVLAIMTQIYDALAAAHAAQVFHRDIKPSNVMIGNDGRVMLIDFGVAYAPGSSTGETMAGSLRYTDPSILEGEPPDAQSDLFSAALLQIELMTGETVLPDLAPLPLYRHIKRNLETRLDVLLDGSYPPLAALARRFTLRRLASDMAGDVLLPTARDAATAAHECLRNLTQKTPDLYLAEGLCQGVIADPAAERMILAEADVALRDQQMTPKEKASWIGFKAAADSASTPEALAARTSEYRSKFLGKAPTRPERRRDHNLMIPKFPRRLRRLVGNVGLPSLVLFSVFLWMKLAPNPVAEFGPTSAAAPGDRVVVFLAPPTPVEAEVVAVPTQPLMMTPVPVPPPAPVAEPVAVPQPVAVNLVANAWAIVLIDGHEVGRLPQAAPFKIVPGHHLLSLSNPAVEPLSAEIVVEAGKPLRLLYKLKAKVVPRVVTLATPGHLFVDGKDQGVVIRKTLTLSYGTHQMWIQRGGKTVGKPHNVALGPDTPAEIALE